MCAVFKNVLEKIYKNIQRNTGLENYLQGSTSLAEIEQRQREWLSQDHGNFR